MRQENRQFSEILTKIGDGNILTEEELKVMESRFITKEEAQSVCPEGIRLLFTNAAVNAYNYSVLNSVDDKIISVASDVITGCHNPEQENFVRQKLHKMKTDETGGLPYELILVLNRPYMITNNIDVADGLSNGTVGKLYHVERDENGDIIRIWLKFPKSCGRKQATKLRNLSARLNLDDDAVPITSQTSSVALNNNKTIIAKRKHFPLVSALAMTIHKSQGDFNFVASYKRPEVPAAGVAIYQHAQDTSHIVTSYMDIHTKFTRGIGVNVSDIGEICVARCNSENGQYLLMVAVYISPENLCNR
ncbi:ATP-dependent DNA helicase [Trichonephila clavipes]|nr:ATP-dependent DNA helicase [Trichonephila clavipes]